VVEVAQSSCVSEPLCSAIMAFSQQRSRLTTNKHTLKKENNTLYKNRLTSDLSAQDDTASGIGDNASDKSLAVDTTPPAHLPATHQGNSIPLESLRTFCTSLISLFAYIACIQEILAFGLDTGNMYLVCLSVSLLLILVFPTMLKSLSPWANFLDLIRKIWP
jgi:hypothetical protein